LKLSWFSRCSVLVFKITTMTSNKSPNWLAFYRDLPTNDPVNKQMEQLSNLFSRQVNDLDFIQNLKENQGSFILGVDHFNNVILLHQVSILGPSIFQPEQFILALSGAGSLAARLRLHPATFSTVVEETPCPTWGSLKGAATSTEVLALTVPEDTTIKIKSRCIAVVPPLVALSVLSAPSQSAQELIPIIIDAFKLYDQSSEDVKACTSLRHVIFFLWGVTQNKIPPISMAFDCSAIGASWFANLHSSCIDQPVDQPALTNNTNTHTTPETIAQTKVFSDISEILHTMRAESDRSRLRVLDDDDDKADAGWKVIPPLLQDMIIRASAVTDSTFPSKPTDSLLQIL
jgi:hypothetical protein